MRRSREDTAATRQAIVKDASRLFRARGIDAVSVADVMGEQGLTVGGFYRHFADKEQLVAEAIAAASEQSSDGHAAATKGYAPGKLAARMLERYLSKEHCEHPEAGCPVAALCSDVAHGGPAVRASFTRALRRLLQMADEALPGDGARARERRLHAAAAMVGAVVLARATDDPALADALLRSVRRGIEQASERESASPPRRARATSSAAARRRR
jgi:TetR/AcrR family transcriptional repressor of nem operon